MAQESPSSGRGLVLTAEQAYLQERNPLRLPADVLSLPGPTAGDSALASTLGARFGAAWGRQRLSAFGRWTDTRYEREQALDHLAYQAGLGLDLETAAQWGARLTAVRRQDPLEGQARLDPIAGTRRLQELAQMGGTLQWGLQRRWVLELQAQNDRMDPNRPQAGWTGYEQTVWRTQGRWREFGTAGQGQEWALARRWTSGTQFAAPGGVSESPNLAYQQALWEAQWLWRSSPGNQVNLRAGVGRGRREWSSAANTVPPPPFEQAVRSMGAEMRWQPRAAWSMQGQWARDEGQQTQGTIAILDGAGLALQGASDVRQARLQLQWEPTRRLQTFLSLQRVERIGQQSWVLGDGLLQVVAGKAEWRDRLDRYSWGGAWQLGRTLSLRCAALREGKWALSGGDGNGASVAESRRLQWRDTGWQCAIRWQGETGFG